MYLGGRQRIMRSASSRTVVRVFSFRDGHGGTTGLFFKIGKLPTIRLSVGGVKVLGGQPRTVLTGPLTPSLTGLLTVALTRLLTAC